VPVSLGDMIEELVAEHIAIDSYRDAIFPRRPRSATRRLLEGILPSRKSTPTSLRIFRVFRRMQERAMRKRSQWRRQE
jgi:hypothetical protein